MSTPEAEDLTINDTTDDAVLVIGNGTASVKTGISLAEILSAEDRDLSHPDINEASEDDEAGTSKENRGAPEGFCVECEDQPAETYCENCAEDWCSVCFTAFHRKGNRKRHATRPLKSLRDQIPTAQKSNGDTLDEPKADDKMETSDEDEDAEGEDEPPALSIPPIPSTSSSASVTTQPAIGEPVGDWYLNRARYIPLRLSLSERKYLRLLEAALLVSEYTDKIDTYGFGLSKAKRIVVQIRELCAILSGLIVASDYKLGQELFGDRDFETNAQFFQEVFELGRRHKVMNPEKMRETYGQLMYVLMDSQISEVKELLGFTCVRKIRTVYTTLKRFDALDLLKDDLITAATQEISAEGRLRHEIQRQIRRKERAIEQLAKKYSNPNFEPERVRQCLYSIGDNEAFLRVNRDPCIKMIDYLKKYFHPKKAESGRSLAIRSGVGGARLSHDHARQYAYCLQSLTLWKEILHEMFQLWCLAEEDLLSTRTCYRLRDTGQGLNRIQAAPATSRMMHAILHRAQTSIGSWVGSSVIHMGDHNVPNALMFIDKYSQIYRILLPICTTLNQIPALTKTPAINSYITAEYGTVENLYIEILGDFFRHAFDGSGADNFFDAGSCIDGRLTSAWNWCSSIEKKRYFHIFLLTGFVGFDGQW